MKILKRNQIIISVLALMLITVGYMSFTSNMKNTVETGKLMDAEKYAGIGDARLVNSNNAVNNDDKENLESDEDSDEENSQTTETSENNGTQTEDDKTKSKDDNTSASSISTNENSNNTAKTTSAYVDGVDYFTVSKLERDTMYSEMLETYQNILENNTIAAEQKNISTQEITNINSKKNSIMIAENLIKNLGYEDVVIFVNDNSTSVIIKAEKLEEADIAKIQNIVCREIGVESEKIHISLK